MPKATAPAAATGLPANVCTYDWGTVRLPPFIVGENFHQAWALHDALRTLGSMTAALLCQPRFSFIGSAGLNAAGRCLESLCTALDMAAQDLADEVRATTSRGDEAEYRSRIILEDAVSCCHSWSELAELATSLSED